METCIFHFICRSDNSFKSYYVVWKLNITQNEIHGKICLNRTMQYGNNSMRWSEKHTVRVFKSYYVVWKHTSCKKKNCRKKSLNRTMQYGNSELSEIRRKYICGLNRTMQYGNFTGWSEQSERAEGLNRTMQYGN